MSYKALQNTDCTTVGSADKSSGGFIKDNSVYWHPALYAMKKDGSGYMKVPTMLHKMYYRKPPASRYREPFEFPEGFRMVGGDPFRRSANTEVSGITRWQCMGPNNVGENGGFPTLHQACDAFSGLVSKVHFPHCWNGEDFKQDDPNAHMSHPEVDASFGDCPSTHPIALPHIEFETQFEMNETYKEIDPSSLVLAQGDPTGYGMHGDFFNGWVNGTIPDLLEYCPQDEYGNQDVSTCSGYEPNSTPRSDCKLKNYFEEKVDSPGASLIGCNPISLDPAPQHAVAKLGISTDSCGAGSGGSNGSDDSYEAPSSSAPAYSLSAGGFMSILPVYSSNTPPSMTFAVSTTAPVYVPEPSYGGYPAEGEDNEDDVIYVTEWVETTAVATTYAKRHNMHNHLRKHKRRPS